MNSSCVLVVEDNAQDILVAELLLEELGYNVVIAQTGQEAIEKSKEILPDLILLDMFLPDMTGIEVCRTIKSHPNLNLIPVLFVTGSNNNENVIRGFDAGAVDYVVKPFNISELASRIKTHVELQIAHKQIIQYNETIHKQEMLLVENQRNKIAESLEQKNKELTSSLLQLVSYSEMMDNLLQDVQKITRNTEADTALLLESVYSNYRSQMSASNWKEFETRFLQVNQDFTRKLQTDYPSLTSNELKLSAFVSLNLSTKDISAITLQTEDSIKKARYRLRKKLGLDEKDNLLAFLSKY